jgi:hypothetical protein
MMAETWEAIRDGIVGAVEARAKKFLDDNQEVRKLLLERASRLAKLTALYAVASAEGREVLQVDLAVVRQTMENDLAALQLNASVEARSAFTNLVGVAFDAIIKALPGILSAL